MKLVSSARAVAGVLCLAFFTLALSSCASSPEAKSARFIEAGKKLMRNKDASRAILQFQNAARVTPKNPEAYYQLGMAFLAAGDIVHGIGSLRKTLELEPKHKSAQLQLAKLMTLVEDKTILQDAGQRLRAYLQGAPDDADALHSLALTELKLGDSEGAVRDLSHAMASAPQEVQIAAMLAEAKLQKGDAKGAEEVLKKAYQNVPNSVPAVVLLGRFYFSQNRVADAEKEFRQALTMNAKDASALLNLGLLQLRTGRAQEAEQSFRLLSKLPDKTANSTLATFLFQNGRKDEAVKEFERLSQEDSEDRMARTRLVMAYQAVGRGGDAEKLLAASLKKNGKDLDALLQRGEILLAAGKFNEAESDLNEVLHLQPVSPGVHFVLGRLYQARGETLRYQQELSKSLELNPLAGAVRLELVHALTEARTAQAALDILDAAPASQKDSLAFLAARNWVLWAQGDMAELRKGIDKGLSQARATDFLLQDGLWKLRAGNVAAARSSLEEALKVNPSDVRALSLLKESYDTQKQTAAALEKVKEYAARQPHSAPTQEFLGAILLARGDNEGAQNAFQAAKAADAHSVQADLGLAQVDVVQGKLDKAQTQLEGVLSGTPANAIAHLWLAEVELMRADRPGAEKQFRAVLAAQPENPEALNNLAYLMTESGGQPAEALKYAQKAKELAPDRPEYSDTLGWILYKHGLYPSAVQELERATAKSAKPTWEYHLAMAYAKAGDDKRARSVLDRALKQDPKLPEAQLAQQVVRSSSANGR